MKLSSVLNGADLFIEIRPETVIAMQGEEILSLPVERTLQGLVTSSNQDKIVENLRGFLKKKKWQTRARAFCAIDARGASLRALSLPACSAEEFPKLLRLQIESEFPLPPDELAWGWLRRAQQPTIGEAKTRRELVVVAVKKEILEDYARLFARCGITPVFTLAALARTWGNRAFGSGNCALLDVGQRQSELISFNGGVPASLRVISWGGENINRELQQELKIPAEDAERVRVGFDNGTQSNGESGQAFGRAVGSSMVILGRQLGDFKGQKIFLSGNSSGASQISQQLANTLGGGVECSRLTAVNGAPAAIGGLRAIVTGGEPQLPLVLRSKESRATYSGGSSGKWSGVQPFLQHWREALAQPDLRRWAIRIALLAVIAILFPLIEAVTMKPYFAKKLASLTSQKSRLAVIDREYGFLQFLKQNEPPYLDTLAIIASDSVPGTRLDSISMNRRGEVAIKGSMQNATQVTDFRSKLIKSGFFASVTVEEQSPTPDRQKINVRMNAQLKPLAARDLVSVDTILSNAPPLPPPGSFSGPASFAGPPPMMFPPGMPVPGGPPPEIGGMPPGVRPGRKSGPSSTVRIGPNGQVIISTNKGSSSTKTDTNSSSSEASNPATEGKE
jgi:Tfp pilus assembly PilM family ATPase